jgi:hypothetical protein
VTSAQIKASALDHGSFRGQPPPVPQLTGVPALSPALTGAAGPIAARQPGRDVTIKRRGNS